MFDPLIRTILSIDPGICTGWALISYEDEKVISFGELKSTDENFLWDLQKLFDGAEFLIIEDQHLDEKIMNPLMVIRLSQAAGIIIGAWMMKREQDLHAGIEHLMEPKYSYHLMKAPSWQKSLRLPARASRKVRKYAARRVATLLTGKECPENASDAICMGTAFIRSVKARQKGMI